MSKPNIYITKLAAAERQLRAAIRIFFLGEDELAVHSVAAAAYGLLKDLKAHMGRDEAADTFLNIVFYAVRDYKRGTLPRNLKDNPAVLAWIENLSEKLPITANSEFKEVVAAISKGAARDFWRSRNATANFLKHASHDPQGKLSLNEVDNADLLIQVYCSYVDLTQDNLYPEGYVLFLFFCATKDSTEDLTEYSRKFVTRMIPLTPSERIRYCSVMIEKLSKCRE